MMTKSTILVSEMAQDLVGSEILRIAGEVNLMKEDGHQIANYTVGDFNPDSFPIPDALTELIIKYYREHKTNYPEGRGIGQLRKAVADFLNRELAMDLSSEEVLIGCGARPMIYATYLALVDPGDTVVYGVPSWNNNHYCHIVGAIPVEIRTLPENNFMLTAAELAPYIGKTTLVALNSPMNPTGTVYTKNQLLEICELVLEENKARAPRGLKPCYVMYDQVYWKLTFGHAHQHPVDLLPALKDYVIYIDGISKYFAATGVRVGWAVGPEQVISRMNHIVGHMGAWAPKPEQLATATFLGQTDQVEAYVEQLNSRIYSRLELIHTAVQKMKAEGLPIESIEPQGGIYLSIRFDVLNQHTQEGRLLTTNEDIRSYLLEDAFSAFVPFQAFGVRENDGWFRISVGAISEEEIARSLKLIELSLRKLKAL